MLQIRHDVRFIIVCDMAAGQGGYLRQLRQSVKAKGLEERVLFAGHLHNDYCLMSTFGVFAFCTKHAETCPNTVIEAMVAGVRVVPTAVGGGLGLDGRTGFLVLANDEAFCASKLLCLLAHPEGAQQIRPPGFPASFRVFFNQGDDRQPTADLCAGSLWLTLRSFSSTGVASNGLQALCLNPR